MTRESEDDFAYVVQKKIEKLQRIMIQTQPFEELHLAVFKHNASRLQRIIEVIDEVTKEFVNEREALLNRNKQSKERIADLQQKLSDDKDCAEQSTGHNTNECSIADVTRDVALDLTQDVAQDDAQDIDRNGDGDASCCEGKDSGVVKEWVNYNLEYELLKNEEEKSAFEVNLLARRMQSLITEIQNLKRTTSDDSSNNNSSNSNSSSNSTTDLSVNLCNYKMLQEIYKNEYLKFVKKEKKRIFYFKFIFESYKKMGIKNFDFLDNKILNNFYEVNFEELKMKFEEVKNEIKNRKSFVEQILSEIKELEENISGIAGSTLSCNVRGHFTEEASDINEVYIESLRTYKNELVKIENMHFENIFEETFQELKEICDIFGMEIVNFEKNKENLKIIKKIINELKTKKEMFLEIKNLIQKREEIKNKMIEFEKNASDPKRLFKSSFQLMHEEKFRKNAVPSLLKIENALLKNIEEYEANFEKLLIKNENYKKYLENEIKNRIINKSVFIMHLTPRKKL